jgi:hypothetical protein
MPDDARAGDAGTELTGEPPIGRKAHEPVAPGPCYDSGR